MNNNILNKEQKIILLSATQIYVNDDLAKLESLLHLKPDWTYISSFSLANGTAPLLYKSITQHNWVPLVPNNIYNALQNSYFQTQATNLLVLNELKKVLLAFVKEGIKPLVIKGMASAEYIYKDLGLRPMGDIDLMVEQHRLADAEKILFCMGFVNSDPYKSFKLRFLNINSHLRPFVFKTIKIELHSALSAIHHIYRIPTRIVWENISQKTFDDVKAYTLNTPYNIMYLSLHAVQHLLKKKIRLNSFVDISELIKSEKEHIDWELIIHDSIQYNISNPVYKTLRVCREFLNAPIPDYVTNKLHKENESIRKEFYLMMCNKTDQITFKTPSDYIKKLKKIEGLPNKVRYMWSEFFPSKEYIAYHYKLKNKNLYILYYFVQFYKQLIKFLKNIF